MKLDSSTFQVFPILETERLILRRFCKNDITFLYGIRSDKSVSKQMGLKNHTSISETKKCLKIFMHLMLIRVPYGGF